MSTLERAIEIAAIAHSGQPDKAGAPYVLHALRVMLAVSGPYERLAAVLHDVVEDTAITLTSFSKAGSRLRFSRLSTPLPSAKVKRGLLRRPVQQRIPLQGWSSWQTWPTTWT
jgi:hypothetical protein